MARREQQREPLLSTPDLVQRLRELLGSKLVAYLGSATDTRTVREWADPTDVCTPPDDAVARLRIAHEVATLIGEKESATVVQSWFQGRNPLLDDMAPARALRDGEVDDGGANVMAAARAFAGSLQRCERTTGATASKSSSS